jgi:hypothetical protein
MTVGSLARTFDTGNAAATLLQHESVSVGPSCIFVLSPRASLHRYGRYSAPIHRLVSASANFALELAHEPIGPARVRNHIVKNRSGGESPARLPALTACVLGVHGWLSPCVLERAQQKVSNDERSSVQRAIGVSTRQHRCAKTTTVRRGCAPVRMSREPFTATFRDGDRA